MVSGPTRQNQETYLQALATTRLVQPVLGSFKRKRVNARILRASGVTPKPANEPDPEHIMLYRTGDASGNPFSGLSRNV